MKKLLLLVLVIGFSFPVIGQKSSDAVFFKNLSTQRSIDPMIRKAAFGISKNYLIADSLLYYMPIFERAVLSGKTAGTINPTLVKTAQRQYPGNDYKAVMNRMKLYSTEGK